MKSKFAITILFVLLIVGSVFVNDTTPSTDLATSVMETPLEQQIISGEPSISPPNILVYTEHVNLSAGREYDNTMTAINNTYGTDYLLTPLINYTLLDSFLPGKDILLIPEQELASIAKMKTVGTAWASTLTSFVDGGGVVILLDFGNESAPGLGFHIYNESGLMQFGPVIGAYPDTAVTEMHRNVFGDALGRQIAYRFEPRSNTFAVETSDGTIAIDDYSTGNPIGVHKIIGHGHVVFLGFDMSDPDAYYEQIVGNAIRLPNHVVFDYSQQTEYSWTNEPQDQYYNEEHPAVAFVEDLVEDLVKTCTPKNSLKS
jgi:hypothetical protein